MVRRASIKVCLTSILLVFYLVVSQFVRCGFFQGNSPAEGNGGLQGGASVIDHGSPLLGEYILQIVYLFFQEVELFRYVSQSQKSGDEAAHDFNADEEVNNKDVAALFRYVSSD